MYHGCVEIRGQLGGAGLSMSTRVPRLTLNRQAWGKLSAEPSQWSMSLNGRKISFMFLDSKQSQKARDSGKYG